MGAIATQSVADPGYGPRGLALMRDGVSAPETLRRLLSADEQESVRQVAVVDHHGRVAVHTGARCIREAGHRVADGVSAQANIMERATVPDAMVEAYLAGPGDLAERLLAALEAAEAEGGDLRGRQSAACWSSPRGRRAEDEPSRNPRSTCAWRITAIRCPSCAASWPAAGPTGASRWATSWRQAATSRGRSPSTPRRTSRSRTTPSSPSGTASRWLHADASRRRAHSWSGLPQERGLARAAAPAARGRPVPGRPGSDDRLE